MAYKVEAKPFSFRSFQVGRNSPGQTSTHKDQAKPFRIRSKNVNPYKPSFTVATVDKKSRQYHSTHVNFLLHFRNF